MGELQAHTRFTEHRINKTTILYATIVSVVIGGPLLSTMCFALLATATLVLFSAPLMLLFSPIIVPAGLVLAAALLSFGTAVGMAVVGASALHWAYKSVGGVGPGGNRGMDFDGYLEQKGQAYEPRLRQ